MRWVHQRGAPLRDSANCSWSAAWENSCLPLLIWLMFAGAGLTSREMAEAEGAWAGGLWSQSRVSFLRTKKHETWNIAWGSSRSWVKNCLWYRSYQTGQAIFSPSNIASYLQSLDSATFRLLQCCLGKLWYKTSRQTSKTPKSCSAGPNFLKLWRRCNAAVRKFKSEKS